MKISKKITMVSLATCLIAAAIPSIAQNTRYAEAAKINSLNDAESLALKKVPKATVTDVESDRENGTLVYEVELTKGNKEYKFVYRASDAKLLEYEWEKIYVSPSTNKAIIKESKCRTLAEKKVKNGTINSIVKKTDDGITLYKVKMTDKQKSYTLKYHARTGALIEYEWKVIKTSSTSSSSSKTNDGYIGTAKAEQIALDDVGNGEIIKSEFDTDDGVEVYEIEIINGNYEYDYKIDAKTGEILEKEKDWND